MASWNPIAVFIPAALAALFLYYTLSSARKRFPHGPRRFPFIGNAHQVPKDAPWITFSQWKKIYGDIIYLDLAGQPTIVINSRKIASDLMEKRSTVYSDRPVTEMIDLCGFSEIMTLQQYGDNLKKQRRMVAPDFAPSYVHNYSAFQESQMAQLIHNVIKNPEMLASELKLRIGRLILRTTYGYDAETEDDAFLKGGLEAVDYFSIITKPGAFLVDLVPILRFYPRWLPGSSFLHFTDAVKKSLLEACWQPYQWCKENHGTGGIFQPNMISNILQNAGGDLSGNDERQAVWAAVTMLGGGLDTKISTILTFLMCMILNPDVQKKAQAEIDSVIGKDRLPLISDRDRLPYIRSVLAETFRWAPPLPLCVPHVLSQEDVYEDYFLPKGTMILPNIWAMLHDPEFYPDPMAFKPERFNGDDTAMDKANLVFGFGRRVCPGRHFAEGTLFTAIATFLATCDILPGLDDVGHEVPPKAIYSSGTISIPEAFPIIFKARSPQAVSLLAEASNIL